VTVHLAQERPEAAQRIGRAAGRARSNCHIVIIQQIVNPGEIDAGPAGKMELEASASVTVLQCRGRQSRDRDLGHNSSEPDSKHSRLHGRCFVEILVLAAASWRHWMLLS
jgi:hypothetical protein